MDALLDKGTFRGLLRMDACRQVPSTTISVRALPSLSGRLQWCWFESS